MRPSFTPKRAALSDSGSTKISVAAPASFDIDVYGRAEWVDVAAHRHEFERPSVTFEVIPAIDLRAGRCVRLYQGDYAKETVFSEDPAGVARRWEQSGAKRIHVVDLDGAASGHPANESSIGSIRQAVAIALQVGGGLRSLAAIETVLDLGADRAVVGTAAIEDGDFLLEIGHRFGPNLVLGLDHRSGKVATRGWTATTAILTTDLAVRAASAGIGWLMVTDINRDGTHSGHDLDTLAAVVAASGLPVIASGGIATLEHLHAVRTAGASGAIIGRALFDGTLDLAAAIAACS